MFTFLSHNEQDTINFAKNFANNLKIGDIVILSGDLGSGKTKFTKGILSYFGLEHEISSPTFTIVNEHSIRELNIYHFDIYRLNDAKEFYANGFDEYFNKGISIIEWGEKIKDSLYNYIEVIFEKDDTDENIRRLMIYENISH